MAVLEDSRLRKANAWRGVLYVSGICRVLEMLHRGTHVREMRDNETLNVITILRLNDQVVDLIEFLMNHEVRMAGDELTEEDADEISLKLWAETADCAKKDGLTSRSGALQCWLFSQRPSVTIASS